MEFFIKKNATLPLLKMAVVRDGRNDYNNMMDFIEQSSIFFSMVSVDTGIPKISTRPAGFVSVEQLDPNADPEYFVYYQFTPRDTNKVGRYQAQFLFRNDQGTMILPIREELYVNVQESFIADDLEYSSCYVIDFPCCIVDPIPAPTTTTTTTIDVVTDTPTPTPTLTPTVTPTVSVTVTPTITPTISLTPTITPTVTPTISLTPTITPTISLTPTITPTSGSFLATLQDCSNIGGGIVAQMVLPISYIQYTSGPFSEWYSYTVTDTLGNCYNIAGQTTPPGPYPQLTWSGVDTTGLINYFGQLQYSGCTACLNP